jgi:antitoxin component of MazEF toxin-antitoxin module
MKFKTTIMQVGNNTGINVPPEVIEKLGGGKKPAVVVTLNNYSHRSTVAVMGGRYMISLSAENRKNANVKGVMN